MNDEQIRHRFAVLTWAVGISAALTIATLWATSFTSGRLWHVIADLALLNQQARTP